MYSDYGDSCKVSKLESDTSEVISYEMSYKIEPPLGVIREQGECPFFVIKHTLK